MKYFIGIDGGATKTNGVLCDENGKIMAHKKTSGSAIVGKPHSDAIGIIDSLIQNLCNNAGIKKCMISYFTIGLNGIDFEDEFEMQKDELVSALNIPFKNFTLVNDGLIALWGGSCNPYAVILQHGTGLTTAYRMGYGNEFLFDTLDIAELFDIRYQVIPLAARMIDGRFKRTGLVEKLVEYYNIPEVDRFAEWFYRKRVPDQKIKNSISIIYETWEQQDEGAEWLMNKMINDYKLLISTMIKKVAVDKIDVILGGSMITLAPRKFVNLLKNKLLKDYPGCRVSYAKLMPEYGAVVNAGYNCGLDPIELFNKILNFLEKRI